MRRGWERRGGGDERTRRGEDGGGAIADRCASKALCTCKTMRSLIAIHSSPAKDAIIAIVIIIVIIVIRSLRSMIAIIVIAIVFIIVIIVTINPNQLTYYRSHLLINRQTEQGADFHFQSCALRPPFLSTSIRTLLQVIDAETRHTFG